MENYKIGKLYKIKPIPPTVNCGSSFSVYRTENLSFDEERIAKIKLNEDIFYLLDISDDERIWKLKTLTKDGIIGYTRINKISYRLSLAKIKK